MTLAVVVVLAMQKMATIVAFVVMLVTALAVALARRRVMCPPVRMV
ncbi:hypothetical protein ACWD5R_18175 [Streptomyces sp. NPDC002514]